MRSRVSAALATAVICASALAACATPSATSDDKTTVVVGFYPLEYVAKQVGGDRIDVHNLASPGTEAHDVELTPQQISEITSADVVIYQRGMQPALDSAIDAGTSAKVVNVTDVVDLLKTPDGQVDPHLWLDPTNMKKIGAAVAKVLPHGDPAALDKQMDELDASYRAVLAHCERTAFVTSHAAFGYLAKRYGLQQFALRGIDPEAEASPQARARIHKIATDYRLTTIFYETQVSADASQSIARDLGLRTDVLDPLESLGGDPARGTDYLAISKSNLASLQKANGCK